MFINNYDCHCDCERSEAGSNLVFYTVAREIASSTFGLLAMTKMTIATQPQCEHNFALRAVRYNVSRKISYPQPHPLLELYHMLLDLALDSVVDLALYLYR